MRLWLSALAGFAALSAAFCASAQPATPNVLSAAEQREGWRLLFDGATTAGWRNFKSEAISPHWTVEDGALTTDGQGGDIVSADEFENFDLSLEWKISEGGNSGIFFGVVEGDYDAIWRTGPEMQILDNDRAEDRFKPSHLAGANYDLQAPRVAAARPVGEWNLARIRVDHGHVQQWLNGQLVVEYDLWTPAWEQAVAASKFATMPGYGRAHRGHLALQDHGYRVWFRSIRIRALP